VTIELETSVQDGFRGLQHALVGFCPGFSECWVFSAGMKIVVAKNLENTCFDNVLEGFLTRFYEVLCIFKAFGVLEYYRICILRWSTGKCIREVIKN
jgi:hypothetical protein